MSIPSRDIRLRPETLALLALVSVQPGDLLYVDEFPFDTLGAAFSNCALHLVDHNLLSTAFPAFPGDVVEIVDHHIDQHAYESTVAHRVVSYDEVAQRGGTGSCCTLIAQEYFAHELVSHRRDHMIHLFSEIGFRPQEVDSDVATLLTGVILMDTVNMDPKMQKDSPLDAHALEVLLPRVLLPRQVPLSTNIPRLSLSFPLPFFLH
jgi:exopolyphosphatase